MTVQTPPLGLELRDVSKSYGSVSAVRNLHLAVVDGEFLTVLGPSGSGKSTILKMIAGFESVSSGSVLLNGIDVSQTPASRRNIGMVFQNYALFPHMNAAENVGYGLKVRRWSTADRARRVDEMLELVGLSGMGKRLPRELSGGQQQRVALARALAFHPGLLLMDEPLGALDRELRIRMAGEIRRIHRETGTTVVYVTHDREEALTLSDRIAIMTNGRVDSLATPEQLFRAPSTSFAAAFFGGHNVVRVQLPQPASRSSDRVQIAVLGSVVRVPVPQGLDVSGAHSHLSIPARSFELARDTPTSVGWIKVEVVVGQVVYMGDTTRATVTTADGTLLQLDLPGHRLAELEPGSTVLVQIDLSACVLVEESLLT